MRAEDVHRSLAGAWLTRSITPEQINARSERGGVFRRVELRQVDEEHRTVELAFSSELPVERWFGEEILDHSAGAMRLGRMEGGAAVLVNHDWDDQVGVVEQIEIGADRVGRAVVRFGRSARAEEIWQDVVDGIRRQASVGYQVHKVEVESRQGQPDLVRVTDWEPFEISIVSVAADPTVGVGRSAEAGGEDSGPQIETREIPMKTKITRDAQGNLVRAKVDENDQIIEVLEVLERAGEAEQAALRRGSEAEQARVRTLMELGEQYGAEDLARDAVRDGVKPDAFRQRLLDHLNERQSQPLAEPSGTEAEIGMSSRDVGRYSFIRVLRVLANPSDGAAREAAAFELECSRTAAQRMGRDPQGIMVPPDVLMRALNTSTSGDSPGDTGGYLVPTELMENSFVELLRNESVVMRLATSMSGLVGNVDIPRQASGANGYWIGEGQDAPEDTLELDKISLTPKTLAARSIVTRRMMMQSSLGMEALVRRDLSLALALEIDKAAFYGKGSDSEPRGIKNYSGVNAVDFGGPSDATTGDSLPTFGEVVEMETKIAADNAAVNSMAYVMGSGMRGHFKTTERFSGSNGATIWEPGNTVNGYRTEVTNTIASGHLFFGNFADVLLGMWGSLELDTSREAQWRNGGLEVRAMQDVDVVLRRLESFCVGSDSAAPGA